MICVEVLLTNDVTGVKPKNTLASDRFVPVIVTSVPPAMGAATGVTLLTTGSGK
jgi:hypothetical protein